MSSMGRYCKAYLAKQLREFSAWSESKDLGRETKLTDGNEVEVDREINDETILYLQENYVVTYGIFMDEHIVFDQVTDEWKEFCTVQLKFEIPEA